jgi:hypothetical protein
MDVAALASRRYGTMNTANTGARILIKSVGGFTLYEVKERRRRVHYEIVGASKCWSFPLLWSALSKLDRLTIVNSGGAH